MKQIKQLILSSVTESKIKVTGTLIKFNHGTFPLISKQLIELFEFEDMSSPTQDLMVEDILKSILMKLVVDSVEMKDNGMMVVDVITGENDFSFNILRSSLNGIKGYTLG